MGVIFLPYFWLFYYQQVRADVNDGTVDQVSLSNNGTSVGEERTIECVRIFFLQKNIKLICHWNYLNLNHCLIHFIVIPYVMLIQLKCLLAY